RAVRGHPHPERALRAVPAGGVASMRPRYFHGGKAGLRVGDVLLPSPPHIEDGCDICVARAEGRTYTAGEYKAWALRHKAWQILRMLRGVPDDAPIDPPT